MPKAAQARIQNRDPGPPTAMAAATPPRDPTPTAPPTATQMASKGETFPARFWPEDFMDPSVFPKIMPK